MIIFLILISILLIILFTKIKIKIFFTLKNFEYYYCIEIFIYNFKIKKIDKNEMKKYTKKIGNNNAIKLKKIKIEELNINLKIGLLVTFATIFSIPIISTILATILPLLKTQREKIKYTIQPIYNEMAIQAKAAGTVTFRIIDIMKK